MALEHASSLKARNRPETNAGVLTSADQALAVFGKSDGLSVSPVGVHDNRLSGGRGRWHDCLSLGKGSPS